MLEIKKGFVINEALSIAKRLETRRELEVRDLGAPIEGAARFQVFGGIPQRAIVGRVNGNAAVIAPTIQVLQLRTAADLEEGFAL